MRRWYLRLSGLIACLCALGLSLHPMVGLGQQNKINGLPNSTGFGYGARFNPQGVQADWALSAAAELQLDWLAIDLNWGQAQPIQGQALQIEYLDQFMQATAALSPAILISISGAPDWAMQANGPSPELAGTLVREILLRYPGRSLAFELFPAANTVLGWGATPDPAAYAVLLQTVRSAINDITSDLALAAAGLSAAAVSTPAGDMNDLEYLQRLYSTGVQDSMPIVSLRLPVVQGDPLAAPLPGQPVALRHYEEVRQVMLNAGHSAGMIWITGFSWPKSEANPEQRQWQARWLEQAFTMLKAQLYIGAAFYSCLNPPATTSQPGLEDPSIGCLIETHQAKPSLHPAASLLASSIYTARTGQPPPVKAFLEKQAPNTKLKSGRL